MDKKCLEMGKVVSEFRMLLMDDIDNGEPAERGVSEYRYATDYGYAEEVMLEAVDHHKAALSRCGMDRDFAMDILEGEWNVMKSKGVFRKFSKRVEML